MVVPAEWFKEWFNSPYYHQLYFHRDEKEAAAFISHLLEHLQPAPGSRMLDVACGRGRHSKILAAKGFDVTGIDLSFDSIREARKAEADNLHFFQHDMRLPFWINYFHYAFNFFTSFGYFRTERENNNAVRTIASSLQSDGILVLDYLNVHYAEDHLVHITDKEIEGVNFHITKWFDETHFFKKIIVEDEQLNEPLVFVERVAKFTLGDFNDMFSFHHLQLQEVFGDYHFEPYHVKKSPRLIMVARKV
ncbi:MAG: methyltransferase domain-containing protein [Williamsia sp.]|nr:methyltransferase domain-containing protein [Williamsia sp.]